MIPNKKKIELGQFPFIFRFFLGAERLAMSTILTLKRGKEAFQVPRQILIKFKQLE